MHYDRVLLNIIDQAKVQLTGIVPEDFHVKPSPSKWSKQEILGHLIDSAYNNHQRFLRAISQDDLVFAGYDQVRWVVLNNYQQRELAEIIKTWYQVNFHLAQLISQLPVALLGRTTTKHNFHQIGMRRPEEGEPSSLGYLIWDYLFHLEHHLQQLLPDYEPSLPPFA